MDTRTHALWMRAKPSTRARAPHACAKLKPRAHTCMPRYGSPPAGGGLLGFGQARPEWVGKRLSPPPGWEGLGQASSAALDFDSPALPALQQDSPVPEGMCAQQWEVEAPPAQDGQKLAMLGSLPELGAWDMERAVTLVQKVSLSSASRVWTLTLRLPKGARVEYKFLRMSAKGAAVWEDRVGNRVLEVGALTTIDGKPVPQKDSVQSFAGA